MSLSLLFSLAFTLILIILAYNKVNFKCKVNPIIAPTIMSWTWFILDDIVSFEAILLACLCIAIITLIIQLILQINEAQLIKNGKDKIDGSKGSFGTDIVRDTVDATNFNGRTGDIVFNVNENYYTGRFDDDGSSVLIYIEDNVNVGDRFEVLGLDGFKIRARKIENKEN